MITDTDLTFFPLDFADVPFWLKNCRKAHLSEENFTKQTKSFQSPGFMLMKIFQELTAETNSQFLYLNKIALNANLVVFGIGRRQ